jgi:hypothetical protein
MRLPRRVALYVAILSLLLGLAVLRSAAPWLGALLLAGCGVLVWAARLQPHTQRQRHSVTAAWFIYTALAQVALISGYFAGLAPGLMVALLLLVIAGVATTIRSAYQAPRRRAAFYSQYLKGS